MTIFGLTPAGFNMPTEADLLALIEADQRADLSATLDQSESSVLGQLNRIFARHVFTAWQALRDIHDGTDPLQATGDQLTSLAKLTGVSRGSATYSQVDLVLELERGTLLESGQSFVHEQDHPDVRFTPLEDFTAPSDGTFTVRFRAELMGLIDVPINRLTVIATPTVGWTRVLSSGEVAAGHDVDDDDALRVRRKDSLARSGSSTVDAIRADVLAIDDATSVQVFENYADTTDARGIPPHSFHVVVSSPNVSNDRIAQAIFDTRPAGIRSFGADSGTALGGDGLPVVERFSRSTVVEAWLTFTLTPRDEYVGTDAFKDAIATRLDAQLGAGDSLYFYDALLATSDLGVKVTAIALGTSPSPTSDATIEVSEFQLLRFDAGRIIVVLA